ncbi:DHH family phosphoesterase [Methanoregula formicica]|uniref:RecJ-like exonuclease with DnaJ-type Zn-finger domain n=1 Tax=Methanoregula formicica (strain DSM 22288 / NBRC 105244 / SMSP) TaxID=593750 RepID=L0HFW0_METFS|nr:OB-fold nucleic acid binding domain-containing protein [Methanoregula formicica]AGB02656.1 RecJ-like exonuclease with DnaJ-type Zn-finger domain [Methanoregula formicica SMSP]
MSNTSDDILVYRLGAGCDLADIEEGNVYQGKVQGFANFGMFVQLNDRIKGLVHKSNMKAEHKERDSILVRVRQIRPNGNIDLEEVQIQVYQVQNIERKSTTVRIADLAGKIGKTVAIEGEVAQIKQTSGPTIFTIVDETGTQNAAAFIEAGVRAFPEIELGHIVKVIGEVMRRNNQLQIEADLISALKGEDADAVKTRIEQALDKRSEPEDIPLLVKSEVLEKLRPDMKKVAKIIRKAVFTSQPIILRHHADADGICSAVAIEQAVVSLIRESGGDFDADYFLFKRAPSKAPFYEIEDITRDLDFSLKDHVRFGQKMPLVLLTDNGSTEEDEPSYKIASVYEIPFVVIDHHHPDTTIDKYLVAHVNPYHVGGDFGITAGMLGTEVARLINPKVEPLIRHLPAIAGVGDRSEAPERVLFLDLVRDQYPEEACRDIALALDYEQFWLRFNDGREIIKDILNITGKTERHKKLVALLVDGANTMIEDQMSACMPHVVPRVLKNDARLFLIDVEIHAHKFTFPPPGKTSGEVHDRLCREHAGKPVITIGFGPDFAVLRSRGVLMNIPRMVRELRVEIPGGGISGGGHLVVGSIKFVEGMRDVVLEALITKIADAQVQAPK